jgi:hypothetical protein
MVVSQVFDVFGQCVPLRALEYNEGLDITRDGGSVGLSGDIQSDSRFELPS